ncbi:MAG: carboxypeptidase regulatory-like domain-containing protein [Gemmatimonadaceae bacterium]
MRMLRALLIATILWASPLPLAAQTVLGAVVLPDSTPAVGAIVIANDVNGATVGRSLTGQRGDFVLRLSAEGRVRLRVLRIGFRPTIGPFVTVVAGATERVHIVFASGPVALAAVDVRERETCRVDADSGMVVARVWEEARKAMLTSQLSVDGAPLVAEWVEYDRTLDSTSRMVRQQRIRRSRNPTTHAFRSVPAEMLRDQGFVVADTNGTVYYAPDAEALLSDAFVSGHCFRVVPSAAGADLVGVGFVPTRERRDLREIEGTLWVDRVTSELRSFEFRYLNLPEAAEKARPGGTVEFKRLADGHWFVSRWNLRMPQLAMRDRRSATSRTIMARSMAYLRAVQVAGGEVTRAMRGDSVVYQATGPSIAVQLVGPDASAQGATLTLDGTDYVGKADSTGRIRVSPVLAGRYRAAIRTPLTDLRGVPPMEREVATHDDARVDSLTLPTAAEGVASACQGTSMAADEGLLHGRVVGERGERVAGAVITAAWPSNFAVIRTQNGARAFSGDRTLQARTDDGGRWRVCGVPTGAVVTVTVSADSGSVREQIRMNGREAAVLDLVLRPMQQGVAALEIVVTDDRGAPVADAVLDVSSASAAARTILTDAGGRALVPNVEPGRVTVRARRIGFTAGQIAMMVTEGRVRLPIVMSAVRMPVLDTMRVVGAREERGRLADFEARRLLHQATVSITREEIQKRNSVDTWQMLTGLASIDVTVRDSRVVATSRRSMISEFNSTQPCFVLFMVDGVPLRKADDQGGVNLQDLPKPDEIHGIEVFAGPSTIPLQYSGTGAGKWCGLIAIWTL